MKGLLALFSGFLFGFGLLLSGMANPAKVLAFLDIIGKWDPSLLFVMLGGISIGYFVFRYAKRVNKTVFGEAINCPSNKEITKPLVLGSLLFGIGWGLIGLCPGPAIVAVGALNLQALLFTGAMLGGMLLHRLQFSS